jgi:D-amino-acid dehydrogenase
MRKVVVVGGGIVGLACARRLQMEGAQVTVIDSASAPDKRCSYGNAGGIAVSEIAPASIPGIGWKVPGWLLDPLGPLSIRWRHIIRLAPWIQAFIDAGQADKIRPIASALASLNALVYEDLIPLLADLGLSGDLHRLGAIVVYSSAAALERDSWEWELRRYFGIPWKRLTAAELTELEPNLSSTFQIGVLLPSWGHVANPQRIVSRLGERLVEQGGELLAGEVSDFEIAGGHARAAITSDQRRIEADCIVVAAGAWSSALARTLGDRVLLESERGYNTTLSVPAMRMSRELIFAEAKFVVTPLEGGLRVGGAAEFAGLIAPPNFKRADALLNIAKRALPGLATGKGTVWMGHRPATPDSLPVIGASRRAANVYYAFGHGHLGLTQAASTARLVTELCSGRAPSINLAPFSPGRFLHQSQ